jgi:S1-C subfamily serine protease/Na+-translocating ferredoxin:NAD+ oxidoreductase RnfD subunit
MSESVNPAPKPRVLTARRLVLLAGAAGLGVTVLFGGAKLVSKAPDLSLTNIAYAQGLQRPVGFADIVEKVKPAVISVRVKVEAGAKMMGMEGGSPFPPGSQMERFFRRFNMPEGAIPDDQRAQPRGRMVTGQGSGFFISADGYAVTNNHVVDKAAIVEITTDDGKTYTAKVIGTDPRTDVALLKAEGRSDFPFVKLGDKNPRIGDWVLAVGNPFGLGGTVTAGIVSARGRDIGAGPYDDFIQIDAPVNKGNSGGPTFDVDGNVIGVNTAIFSPSGGSVGIAFAIPSETVRTVVTQPSGLSAGAIDRPAPNLSSAEVRACSRAGPVGLRMTARESPGSCAGMSRDGNTKGRRKFRRGEVRTTDEGRRRRGRARCKKLRHGRSPHVTTCRLDPRLYQIAVLSGLLLFGVTALDFDLTIAQILVTLATAAGTQLACARLLALRGDTGVRSALISGLSLCLLLRTDVLLLAAAAAGIAVGSKFVLRVGGKHLFNPTNGAIVGLLTLATAFPALDLSIWVSPGQWGNTAFFLLLMGCLGTIVVTRAARADVTFAFLTSWAGLLLFRAWALGDPVAIPLHRLQNGALLLFAFFMISDPKTTPDSRWGRVLFGALVALVAYYVQFKLFHTNGLLWSLAACSLLVPLIDWLVPGSRYAWTGASPLESAHETPPLRRSARRVRSAVL